MTRGRFVVVGFLVLAAGIFIAWLGWLPALPPNRPVTLPDGSVASFAGTSYGKKVIFPPTGSWKQKLAFLPGSILQRLKINPGPSIPVESNHLVIWLSVTPPGSFSLFGANIELSLVDENGDECSRLNTIPDAFPSYSGANGSSLLGLNLRAFPRRGRNFKLRIYGRDPNGKLSPLGEMTIPNPAFHRHPEWQAAALPVTVSTNGIAITLTKLLTGTSLNPSQTNGEVWGKAFFTLTEGGKPCADWKVDTIEFSDATGNQAQSWAWGYEESKPGEGTFRFCSTLWPTEPAWKLNATLKRKAGAKFAANELWTITNLPLPVAYTTLNLTTNLNGIKVGFLTLANESGSLPPRMRAEMDEIKLDFDVPALPADMRFDVVRVVPQDGGTNSNAGGRDAQWAGASGNSYQFVVPASTRAITVEAAVYRQLTAEYIVEPMTPSAVNASASGAK